MAKSVAEVDVVAILEDVAKYNGLTEFKIVCDINPTRVNGLIAKITEAQIVSKYKNLSLVVKSYPATDKIRTIMPVELILKREVFMYESIFRLFRNFEIDHGMIPIQLVPTFYKSYNNQYNGDAIVLENLSKIGFSIYDKNTLYDDAHIKLCLKKYAQFNAISLAYQDQNPTVFKQLLESMRDFYKDTMKRSGITELFVKQMTTGATLVGPELHQKEKTCIENFIPDIEKFILNISVAQDEFSVILHGDCWMNNLMFKYDDTNNPSKPTELRFIDFQFSRYGSPMLDIANLFYACSCNEVVDKMQHYLDFYYDNLSCHLGLLGSNPKKVYPRKVMMEQWKKFARYGLLIRMNVIRILLSKNKEPITASDVLESETNMCNLFDYEISDMKRYQAYVLHNIRHFIDNDLI